MTFGSRDLTAVPCAMAALLSTFCWPSVTIKCGTQVLVRRKVVKAECEDTFGEVLERVDPSFVGNSVVRVVTSKNERFLDPIHEVPLNAPIILSEQYGNNVCYYLLEEDTSTPRYIQIYMSYMYMHILIPVRNNNALFLCRATLSGRNAFEIMMTSHPHDIYTTSTKCSETQKDLIVVVVFCIFCIVWTYGVLLCIVYTILYVATGNDVI